MQTTRHRPFFVFVPCSSAGVPDRDILPDSALPAMSLGFKADQDRTGKKDSGEASRSDFPSVGDIVEGTVDTKAKAWAPPSLMVRLDSGVMGRVCVTELADDRYWKNKPLSG